MNENPIARCPLCDHDATVRWNGAEHVWMVDCLLCTRFTIDTYLMDVIRAGRADDDDRVCRLLPWLSAAAQDTWEEGRRLNLAGENWQAVAYDTKIKHEKPH